MVLFNMTIIVILNAPCEKKIDVYLKDNNNTKLKDAIKKYEEFLDKVLLQFSTIQEYVDTGDFAQASIALGSDFQNLVRDMGEKTETNLTENLEGGISGREGGISFIVVGTKEEIIKVKSFIQTIKGEPPF